MAPAPFPIAICIAALFFITLLLLFAPYAKQTQYETLRTAITQEIEGWQYQADRYFEAEDWTGFYGAISKIEDAAMRLIELEETYA